MRAKFLAVEGEVFAKNYGFQVLPFVEAFKQYKDNREEFDNWLENNPFGRVIQGQGGLHRYRVRLNGEIVFLKFYAATGEYLLLAQQAGFRVS